MTDTDPTPPHGIERPEVCDNCGTIVVAVRNDDGRFCDDECANAYVLGAPATNGLIDDTVAHYVNGEITVPRKD